MGLPDKMRLCFHDTTCKQTPYALNYNKRRTPMKRPMGIPTYMYTHVRHNKRTVQIESR